MEGGRRDLKKEFLPAAASGRVNSSPLPPSTESKINDFPFYATFPSLEGGRGIFRLGPSESSSRLSRHAKGCKAKRGKRGGRRSNYPRNQICFALLPPLSLGGKPKVRLAPISQKKNGKSACHEI